MKQWRILKKNVGEELQEVVVDAGYETMSEIVGGYIECVGLPLDIDMWLNEEGLLIELPLNLVTIVNGKVIHQIVGNIFFASHDDMGDTISLNDKQIEWIKNNMHNVSNFLKEKLDHKVHGLVVR